MICDKCKCNLCKVYGGICRKFRILKRLTFGLYGKKEKMVIWPFKKKKTYKVEYKDA